MTRHTLKQFLQSGFIAIAGALALTSAVPALAAGGSATLAKANNDVANVASLQRGARNFVNYCLGCHSAKYVRYNQLARDLGMSEEQVIANLMFGAAKPTETMDIAMRSADAQRWFGQAPPDLSLIARSKGVDYVYSFLRSFYLDPARPNGVNNLALPNASMPHVLWELQGLQTAIFEEEEHNGMKHIVFQKFEHASAGTLTPEQFDEFVRDTVNFLDYIAEPMKLKRQNLGLLVITFLLVFGLFAYLLKLEIWKDVK
jgi:ubiquinol-cytochrome c reductase cytochrome c1 subunit